LSVEVHPLTEVEGGGQLVLVSDPEAIEALEADARLASQLEGLGRVYRAMAHELKAPLSAIMINLDLLRESLTVGESAERERQQRQRRYVDVLRDELNRLNRSLYGILTQTVPETKALEFDVVASLRDLATLLAAQARKQGVALETELGPEPLIVRGYPDRLRQAFLNLAVNALEAMPRGGRLRLAAARAGDRAEVEIRDTGGGISPPVRERIFDLDFSTKKGGSGVGLYVARALVELHGGEVKVDSQVGEGTRVRVMLPVAGGGA
jgi:signal transduction histidine kinase